MSKKKLIWIVLGIIIIFIQLILIYLLIQKKTPTLKKINQKKENTENSKDTPAEVYSYYLIPVTTFTNSLQNIESDELENYNFITLEENKDFLPNSFTYEYVDETSFLEKIKQNSIGLLTPKQINETFKTITIDKKLFWDEIIDDYPFVYENSSHNNYEADNATTIFTAGEIIPARGVDMHALNPTNNYTYLFDFYKDDIQNSDIAITMLENGLLGDPVPCNKCMVFIGDDRLAKGIEDIGFDFISLSGNHAGDAGQDGYKNTIELFEKTSVQFTGTGKIDSELLKPATKEVNGINYGMLAADEVARYYHTYDNPDLYGTNSFDNNRYKKISTIKKENRIDYMIIYMSWGIEYTNYANQYQINLAHEMIDYGADLIIASHPHWVQNIEFYKGKPIIYSLGNFIFDQTHTQKTREGMSVKFYFYDNEIKYIRIIPHLFCGPHQTSIKLNQRYLDGEFTLNNLLILPEDQGCVYYQPKTIDNTNKSYADIFNRVYEFTDIKPVL